MFQWNFIRKIKNLPYENTTLKDQIESLRRELSSNEENEDLLKKSTQIREPYEKLVKSEKALETLLGSSRSSLRKEGLGYSHNDSSNTNPRPIWVKEGCDEIVEFPELLIRVETKEVKEKYNEHRTYLMWKEKV